MSVNFKVLESVILMKLWCSARYLSVARCMSLQEVKDKTCSRSLEKFSRSLKDSLQKLAAGEDGAADASAVFDSPAVDPDNQTQQVCQLEEYISRVRRNSRKLGSRDF